MNLEQIAAEIHERTGKVGKELEAYTVAYCAIYAMVMKDVKSEAYFTLRLKGLENATR